MRNKSFALLVSAAAFAACDRAAPPEPKTTGAETEAVSAVDVAATDEFGPFDAAVNDIAFWTHPTLAFNGLALVATANGVVALNIEDGAEVARLDIGAVEAIDVAYIGYGTNAQGYLGISAGGEFRLAEIDNITREMALIDAPMPALGGARGFCLAAAPVGAIVLRYDMQADGWAMQPVYNTGGMQSPSVQAVAANENYADCTAGDAGVYLLTDEGLVYTLSDSGAIEAFQIEDSRGDAIGVVANEIDGGGAADTVVIFDSGAGVARIVRDGATLGAVRIGASFDIETVSDATAVGVGSGNFGGVYRDGVIAMGVGGDQPAVRLVPFNGVMDSLGEAVGAGLDARTLAAPEEEDELVINVNLVTE